MGFVKQTKGKAYFKRYQVKWRRRRESKTDYRARKRMICQDKNKYNSPKFRFVVRFSNRDIVCQVARAKIVGDEVLASAYSHELKNYGMTVGLTNYAAAYATGLLCARRILAKMNLADKYEGTTEVNGEDFYVEALEEGPKPFYALLDVGLRRTTTGNKVFAAMKGAADGGVEIPHSEKRFVGYDPESKTLNAEVLRKHIFGGHVSDYMNTLKEQNPTSYEQVFSKYNKSKVTSASLEEKWAKVHAAIRKNPARKKSTNKAPAIIKRYNHAKRSLKQRKDKIKQKMEARARKEQA